MTTEVTEYAVNTEQILKAFNAEAQRSQRKPKTNALNITKLAAIYVTSVHSAPLR